MALHVGWGGGSPLSSTAPYQRCNRSIIFLWKGVTAMTMMTYVGKQRVSLGQSTKGFLDPLPEERLLMIECPFSTKNSRGIGKSTPSALATSLDPRDFSRTSASGNLSGVRKSLGSGMDFPIPLVPRFVRARIQ